MSEDFLHKLTIGCLGALTPIVVNLLVVDLRTTLAAVTWIEAGSYAVRVFALCASACIVVFLNSDETRPVKLFQLGIAAPALLTSLINGVSAAQNAPPKVGFEIPSIIERAYAQPVPRPASPSLAGIDNCLDAPQPSVSQQVLKGLIGILPDDQWLVVVGSYGQPSAALAEAADVNRRVAPKYKARVCQPVGETDGRYRVIVGDYQSYAKATLLKQQVVSAGLNKDAWVWNPFEATKAQR